MFFAFIISLLLTFELTLAQLYHILFEVEEENEVASASKPKCKAKETSEDVVAVISDTTKKKEASSLTINQFSDSKKEKKESFASVELKKIKPKKQTEEDIGIQTPSFDESDEEKWTPPALDLLEYTKNSVVINEKDLHASAKAIEEKLAQFGIEVSMNDVHVGPTVMQYTMRPAPGVKLSKIQGLTQDVALALQAHALRIEAPIPGTDLVGLEIPNKNRLAVSLREIFESDTFREMKSPLRIVMGRDVAGKPMVADLAKMPHVLVAGNTGSGKSVFVNTLLLSLLYQNSPNDLKLILVDPKQVELGSYNNIPHLLTPVINDAEKALSSLKWAVAEMNRRYREMAQKKVRHISEFNEQAKKEDRWPYIVIVIDEMADLMMTAGKDVEALIVRLAQMARAVGIHLVLATQRPSVNVITGLIKANVPTRVAFTVASQVDSRTIIDKAGAEALLGRGDFLFLMNGESNLTRVQSAYVTTEEVNNVVYKIRMNSPKDLETQKDLFEDEDVQEEINTVQVPGMEEKKSRGDMGDELYEEAVQVVVKHQKASATMLQRYLSVGYARAAKLIDLLEQEGVISPSEGSKPRKVYWKGQSGELDHSSDIVL
ncbi:MAG: DNA translocase FtsK [Patescibacteria group bacterium]|nr:DNA translocase FtsK [Patescibacteria group bacterium]